MQLQKKEKPSYLSKEAYELNVDRKKIKETRQQMERNLLKLTGTCYLIQL